MSQWRQRIYKSIYKGIRSEQPTHFCEKIQQIIVLLWIWLDQASTLFTSYAKCLEEWKVFFCHDPTQPQLEGLLGDHAQIEDDLTVLPYNIVLESSKFKYVPIRV